MRTAAGKINKSMKIFEYKRSYLIFICISTEFIPSISKLSLKKLA